MPALTDAATGTGAGVRNPAGKEPAGGRAVAVPRSLWVFGHLVCGGRSGDGGGLACVWRATALQQVAMVRLRVAACGATTGSAANRQWVSEAGRWPTRRIIVLLCLNGYRHDVSIRIDGGCGEALWRGVWPRWKTSMMRIFLLQHGQVCV
jgi:hypothetical protein